MAEMWELLQQIWAFASPHWPGLSWMLMSMLLGQVMAHRVFTREQATRKRSTKWAEWLWWWGRKTLALHGAAIGFLVLGVFWPNPEGADPAWPRIAGMMYFGFFGGMSTWAFEVLKGLAKKRGIDLELSDDDRSSDPPSGSTTYPPSKEG